jgi:hypothetical protein
MKLIHQIFHIPPVAEGKKKQQDQPTGLKLLLDGTKYASLYDMLISAHYITTRKASGRAVFVAKKTASSVQPVGAPLVKHVEPATAVESVDVALTATAPTIESSAVAVVVTTCAPLVQHVAASPVEHVQPADVVATVIPNNPVAVGTTAPCVVDSAPTTVASVPHPVDIASVAHPVDIAMTSAPVKHVVGATTSTKSSRLVILSMWL